MSCGYEYSSDFAKVLQNFICLNEIDYVLEALVNPNNFEHVKNMSFDVRYDLIQQIILHKPIMTRDDPKGQKYDEPIAFLLMSIPYENIFKQEMTHAGIIASILKELEWDKEITNDRKMDICSAVKDIYLEIYNDKTKVPIGEFWPKKEASTKALNYMKRLHAVFAPMPTDDLIKELECETDLDKSNTLSIAFMRSVVRRSHVLDLIAITMHEIRHYSQMTIKTPQVKKQDIDVVSHLVISRSHNAYYGLMAERQANAFMGRIEDLVKDTRIRNEIEISSQMLTTQQHGRLSGKLFCAIMDYNDFQQQKPKQKNIPIETSLILRPA